MGFFAPKDYREGALRSFRQPGMPVTKMDGILDRIEADYLALQPKLATARKALESARNLPISRAEVMRVMRLCVIRDGEANAGPIFANRISAIVDNPDFDEAFTRDCDPVLDLFAGGQGPALADAIYFLLPDLILAGIEKRVESLIPKSAKGTLAERRTAIAAAESELADLERQSSELLSQHRIIVDDRFAMPGSHRNPTEPPPMVDEGVS